MLIPSQNNEPSGRRPRLHIGVLMLLGWILFSSSVAPTNVQAQDGNQQDAISAADGERVFREWLSGQRRALSQLATFVIEADVEHRVATPEGERFATYGLAFRRLQDEPPSKGELRYLTLDGDTLDVSESRRVERIISSMMTEELGPMLNGLNLPTALLSRVRVVGPPVRVLHDGRTLIRFMFEVQPPQRDQARVTGRQGPRGGLRPGMRPGAARGGRPGDEALRQPNRPSPRINLFIEESSGRLVMTRIRVMMPGERRLFAETRFSRTDGLDIPNERFVRGDFPMRRRLRTVTVSLDHHTKFRVASLLFKNGN